MHLDSGQRRTLKMRAPADVWEFIDRPEGQRDALFCPRCGGVLLAEPFAEDETPDCGGAPLDPVPIAAGLCVTRNNEDWRNGKLEDDDGRGAERKRRAGQTLRPTP